MSLPRVCSHGEPFFSRPGEPKPVCLRCDLVWHEGRLADAKAQVTRHTAKVRDLIAAISRTCGDA